MFRQLRSKLRKSHVRTSFHLNIGAKRTLNEPSQFKGNVYPTWGNGSSRNYSELKRETPDFKYCVDLLRKNDKKKYMAGLLLPKNLQKPYFTLYAFNVETAIIRDSVRGNEQAGRLRLQWWRSAIDAIYAADNGRIPKHPVIQLLQESIQEHNLTRRWLDRVIDARESDIINTEPPSSMAAVEKYAEHTMGSILYLCLESIGIRDDTADHVASHVGKTIGISTLLFAVPHLSASGYVSLPVSEMAQNGLTADQVLSYASARAARNQNFPQEKLDRLGEIEEALTGTVFTVACAAHDHLHHARELMPSLPKPAVQVFLPVTAAAQYLDELEKNQFHVFNPHLTQPNSLLDVKLQLLLLQNRLMKRF